MTEHEKKQYRKRIECAYQRAMNIRDSTPSDLTESEEAHYVTAYRRAYRVGDVEGFRKATRKYLHELRSFSKACKALQALGVK